MTFTPRAVVGAAIGVAAGNPVLGFVGGVISHHLLDMVPHFDQDTFRLKHSYSPYAGLKTPYERTEFNKRDWQMLFIDWLISGVVFAVILGALPLALWPLILWGALGGLTPDLISNSPLWSR